jgi:hypothetical protein
MLQRKSNRLLPVGLLMLSAGLMLRIWAHGRLFHFGAGFLIGMSAVFLVAGFFCGDPKTNWKNNI